MKIAALLLIAVVVLNCVGKSWQSNRPYSNPPPSGRDESSGRREPSTPRHSRLSTAPYQGESSSSREPSPPPRRQNRNDLPLGSRIIKDVSIPAEEYLYKYDSSHFASLVLPVEAVVNYEGKIVGIFRTKYDHTLYPLYRTHGRNRIKLNPACLYKGPNHCDFLDEKGDRDYPAFQKFKKPEAMMVDSLETYKRMGLYVTCTHPQAPSWFENLSEGSHIIRGVQLPEGFFFKLTRADNSLRRTLDGHFCDAVVDPNKNIVAVFLSSSEHKLLGIYLGETGERVKLIHFGVQGQHFEIMNDARECDSYNEFTLYKKPQEIYRKSLAECG